MIDSSDEGSDDEETAPVMDVYTVLSHLDRIKNEREETLHAGWQANRSRTDSTVDRREPN